MHAQPGDWLLIRSHTDSGQLRKAMIVTTHTPEGDPPFNVRWTDDDHQSVIYPGPDAQIVSAADQAEADRRDAARVAGKR